MGSQTGHDREENFDMTERSMADDSARVEHDEATRRFVARVNGGEAYLAYARSADAMY